MIIFYLALLYYATSDANSQTKSKENYLLKNHDPSKISRKKARKYDKHGLTNFTDYSFVSQTEASGSEVHAGKDDKKEDKEKKNNTGKDDLKGKQEEHALQEGEIKQAVQGKNGEKKPSNEGKQKKESEDDPEDDDNVDDDESDTGEDDEEDGEPKINSIKKGNLKEDKKGGNNKEKKKKTKGDFDDDDEDDEADDMDEADEEGEDEDEEEQTGKKPSHKKDVGKEQKGSVKNDEKGKKDINAHGDHEKKHEEHHEARTAQKHQGDKHDQPQGQKTPNAHENQHSGKEANSNHPVHNNPEVKTNAPNLNKVEQSQPTSPTLSNVAQNVAPTLNAFIPKKQDQITSYSINPKINEDIHIPDDIKKDFMKLLRSVVQLNIKESLHQGNNHQLHGDQQKNSSGMPPTYMNVPPGNGTKNTSFLNKLIIHFKKYLMYYLGGLVVFSAFVLAMQCSD
ncbi:conserved Plasmodium protein, unknown function [Plasmodium knowlesi strain H]|uniref:Uncharacterized protein n=3 Tax=Plasmodium knowlesi TaxID=5850 RepID=A0A5E7WZB2_PLAKH|nr:conserved Plasmodium protein, unknown function [Plasmodium knowlesi strain H]OTN66032.1 Uncharacterized protein PKNOH_S100041600 [Plasmodium knowlesi]CAA9987779.1 conserved Plasmodium protein, unknown function [Plasmodium knowlesi strain H]SBO27107.1 conserved Plasmodium protein, unknown function [Plasmodium knowlesi strain H]SBO29418.1 conserved Plasmodium protein, unknown function [Plasmodium knowlesi strain H]VVS77253.1 conserved Plasmodium protein, unknown function [Plasmodium knowlesi 